MVTLAFVLLGIIVLLGVLLALPVEFALRASLSGPDAPIEKSGRFRWAFGLVDAPIRSAGVSQEKKAKRKPREKPAKSAKRISSRFRARHFVLNPAVWERASTLLVRLVRTIHWRVLRFHGRFGLGDPADTGQLWGALGTLIFLLPSRLDVVIQPVFLELDLAFDAEAEIRFVPLHVVGVLLLFGLSPATWRVLWPVLKNR